MVLSGSGCSYSIHSLGIAMPGAMAPAEDGRVITSTERAGDSAVHLLRGEVGISHEAERVIEWIWEKIP